MTTPDTENTDSTDIAIVGVSGRFPGAADVAELWAGIRAARSGITRFTDEELRAAGVSDDQLADPGYVKAAPVIDGIDLFDAGFFGFGPKEAQILDPQHRLYLEHSWHALEDAGCDPSRFDGAVGVFGGCAWSAYLQNNLVPSGIVAVLGDFTVGLANDKDSLTTRVAHTLGLSGPTYSVQSYCSTSLVAVCVAASSLANYECDFALAGGVAVAVPHRVGYQFQPGGIAPPDGECRAFDAAGEGSPLGSGVGVVALRRLADALADGDRVYAVIRGWAVNNDGGRKAGFTAPSVQGQAAVIAEALSSAGLAAADIDYVEAHGTGTALGDAVEIAALQQVFKGEECLVGSVKTNVGHLDRAAGVTGLIKATLALHAAEIPPTRNLADPNRQLRIGEARLEVVTSLTSWPRRDDRIRRAGVSAFGIGGTNAHVVLEEAPLIPRPEPPPRPEVLVWSARSAAAADAMTERLAGHLAGESCRDALCDVAYTLQSGRRVFEHRRMLVASSRDDAAGRMREGAAQSQREARTDREVGFLIAGTGEQYPGMAADLYRSEPVFAAALDECRALVTELLHGTDPLAEMLASRAAGPGLSRLLGRDGTADPSPGDATERLHPAMFAVAYALARLIMSWGIQPAMMAGYSLGEYVAACLSGVLTLDSAVRLVTHRAQLISALPPGAMAAVPLPVADTRLRIERAGIAGLDIAAVNGSQLTVIAGEPAAIAGMRAFLEPEAVPVRPLATTHAFHSRMLAPAKDELTEWVAANVPLGQPAIPYLSNVTGTLVTAEQAASPGYWAEHMCSPVRFGAALSTLLENPDLVLLELGPGQSLGAMARGHADCPPERYRLVVSSLPAAGDPRSADTVLAEAVGRLWLAGVPLDWDAYQGDRAVAKVGLPGYPFQRQRYWVDAPAAVTARAGDGTDQPDGGRGPNAADRPDSAPAGQGREGHVQLMRQQWDEAAVSGETALPGRCVVLGGGGGLGDALAAELRGRGAAVRCLQPDTGRDGLAEELGRLRPELVVDLRALDEGEAPDDGRGVVVPFAGLADALSDADGTKVIVVTRGGQAVGEGDIPSAGQAAAAALGVVANQEYLNLECRTVDLDPGADTAAAVQALVAECGQASQDVLSAYRGGRRYVREFAAAGTAAAAGSELGVSAVSVRAGGTYLITGGLGDVGLQVAGHLARSGAARLVLTSRAGVADAGGDARGRAVAGLRELGADVMTPAVDVTDAGAMGALLAGIVAAGGRLDGVIHAAADARPETFFPLRYLNEEAVARHFGAKVTGARVLAGLLAELPEGQQPEFCLLFSSTSAVLGGLAFASYAAANAALTAIGLSQAHQGRRTRWIAASWDTWAGTLERIDGGIGATMARHAMTSQEGMDALDRLLASPEPAPLVVAAGLDDRMPRVSAALGGPAADDEIATAPADAFPRPDLPEPYAPPLTATERALAEVWSAVLGVQPVGTRDNFFDLGGNSLVALQMLTLVKKRFGVTLPSVTLFEAPTVHTLAEILDAKGAAAAAPVATAPVATARVVVRPAAPEPAAGPAAGQGTDRRIAVVGMAGRFPGADSTAAFWQNLRDGVESVSFFSADELAAAGVEPGLISDPSYVPARPVLADVSGFDAAFFGISARTAALTDPQQRIFLEVCWEALEQAGYAAPEHRGRVGVFGGCNISTYLFRMPEEVFTGGEVSTYEIIMGNDKDALTTTASYLFDLRGPSVAVQTFCSTSLVAAHLAVQSLRSGDCELALAGGVSVRIPDRVGHLFQPGGMESPDGHVRTFDAGARGSMFGDGAAVVVLKRLADAIRDGDHIWSVIRGSAMNNDGARKVGYTAPSVVGQARVIADAMADASITAEDVSYIEAHGTATELGDPIELAALTRAFGPTAANQYCPIGSAKTNVGHLDRAAGVTGLIKTSYALTHEVIPPSLHYTSPNPDIDFAASPFYVNTELAPWRTRDGRRPLAGINSLGMGGTNVHVVVEQAPARPETTQDDESGRRYQVLPLSARSTAAADQACTRLADHLGAAPQTRLADVAYTLQLGRKTFEHRRALVAADTAQAAAVLSGAQPGGLLSRADAARGRRAAFLFTGVGEQYPGMVAELYRREPVFAAALDECAGPLAEALPGTGLIDLLAGARGGGLSLAALLGRDDPGTGTETDPRAAELQRTEVVQPALFALQYALARTLMTWGVQPQVMLGYSLGEYVAACLAGVFSLPDALALVARRASLIAALAPGSMVAVPLSVPDLRGRFPQAERELDIAAANGPAATVLAGPADAMAAFTGQLRQAGIASRELQTTHAFHSRMLGPVSDELTAWVRANVTLSPPRLPYISNLTGGYADAGLVCDPGYWARHMCQTVQFHDGTQTLLADPELAIVEIGPGQSLGATIRAAGCPQERWPLITSVLPAAADSRPDDAVLAEGLARLWLLGVDVDWATYHGRGPGAAADGGPALPGRIPLPTYAFQRQRYWFEGAGRTMPGTSAQAAALPQPGDAPSLATLDAIAELPKLPEEQWLHLPVWRQTALPPAAPSQPRSWLVYTRAGTADEVIAELSKIIIPNGSELKLVRPGQTYTAEAGTYTIRPGSVADTRAMLRDLRAAGRPPERVVHLWSLGTPAGEETLVEDPYLASLGAAAGEQALAEGLHTLVALARAAGELGLDAWSLDVATCGTQQVVPGEPASPHAATLVGPCRVIPLEYPGVTARLIDLPPDPGPAAAGRLAAELCRPQADATVALRHGRRWVPGFETMTAPAPDNSVLRPGGVYLITGGLGGIGLAMAGKLAAECQAKLVLFGRHGLPDRAAWPAILAGQPGGADADAVTRQRVAGVSALLDLGAEVEIVTGDVSDPGDVRRACRAARQRFGALHGVLHVAGVPGSGLMQFKTAAELDQELAAKVAGTLALGEALRIGQPDEAELDFLVLFSSMTSTTGGGPGQVGYCAANAFLDAYACQAAAPGRTVVSVNWSEWTWNAWDDGLSGYAGALQEFFRANRARIGIDFDAGWRSLLRVLACGEPRVVVSTQDFPTMVRYSTQFTVAAVTSRALADGGGARHPRPDLVTPYQEPSGPTEEKIAAIWCEALHLEQVGVADSFFDLGGNSLLGVGIVADLRTAFGLAELPPHILYEAPTVAALGTVIDAAQAGGPQAAAAADDGGSHVRAQLRRSGLEASAQRRRGQ